MYGIELSIKDSDKFWLYFVQNQLGFFKISISKGNVKNFRFEAFGEF